MVTYADSGHPTIQPVNGESEHLGIPEDFDDELHHREVALEFVGPGYLYWNDGDDEAFDQCKAKAQQTYGRFWTFSLLPKTKGYSAAARDEFVRQGLDEKTQRLQELETEYTRLKASAVRTACSVLFAPILILSIRSPRYLNLRTTTTH